MGQNYNCQVIIMIETSLMGYVIKMSEWTEIWFPGLWALCLMHYDKKLDMSMARRCLKSPQSLSGTSAHPTMVTLVNIMVMNGWLTSFSFHVNRPYISWDKAISDFDLEISTPGSRSYNQPSIILTHFVFIFTSIRPTIPELQLFRNLTLKHPRSRSWVRSKINVT